MPTSLRLQDLSKAVERLLVAYSLHLECRSSPPDARWQAFNGTVREMATAWEYCPRRFYLEYQLGEMADNEHIIMGRHLHRNIDQEDVIQEGDTRIHQQQWVWSNRLQISGIIDAVEEKAGELVPLEYKKGKMANHLNDHFQLCAAALCLEERTGRSIAYGEIFYHSNRRRQRVIFTPQFRQATEQAIAAAQMAAKSSIPQPIDHPKKCQACSLQGICLPFEVKQLLREF